MNNLRLRALGGAFVFGAAVTANASLTYHIQNLGTLGGDSSYGMGLNDAGQVVGWGTTAAGERGFVWDPTTGVKVLSPAGSQTDTRGRTISQSGMAAGYSAVGTLTGSAATWNGTSGTPFTPVAGASITYSGGINASGNVAGWAVTSNGYQAYKWNGSSSALLNGLNPTEQSIAYGINDSGLVVGQSLGNASTAVTWDGAGIHSLGVLDGGSFSMAFGVNSLGHVVGHSGSSVGQRGFVYANGSMTSVGAMTGDYYSSAFGINANDWVVGRSGGDNGSQGFLWRSGSMVSLQSLLVDPSASHWQVFDAQSINSSGQIVGTGFYDGQMRAYLMTPVTTPEPSTWVACTSFALLAARRRRKQ